jgi:hypothetical protein
MEPNGRVPTYSWLAASERFGAELIVPTSLPKPIDMEGIFR